MIEWLAWVIGIPTAIIGIAAIGRLYFGQLPMLTETKNDKAPK